MIIYRLLNACFAGPEKWISRSWENWQSSCSVTEEGRGGEGEKRRQERIRSTGSGNVWRMVGYLVPRREFQPRTFGPKSCSLPVAVIVNVQGDERTESKPFTLQKKQQLRGGAGRMASSSPANTSRTGGQGRNPFLWPSTPVWHMLFTCEPQPRLVNILNTLSASSCFPLKLDKILIGHFVQHLGGRKE